MLASASKDVTVKVCMYTHVHVRTRICRHVHVHMHMQVWDLKLMKLIFTFNAGSEVCCLALTNNTYFSWILVMVYHYDYQLTTNLLLCRSTAWP